MASPTKPGQRVMLTGGGEHVPFGEIGVVALRLTDWFTGHRWHVRLDTGRVVEVRETELFLLPD
jgi:hypothetical protein